MISARARRRAARRAATALALGCVSTLAVAWGSSLRGPYGAGPGQFAARARSVTRTEGPGVLRLNRFDTSVSTLVESVARDVREQAPGPAPESITPSWAFDAVLPWVGGGSPWPGPGEQERRVARGLGWPRIAMWHEYRWRPDPAAPAFGVFDTPGGLRVERSVGNPGAWPVDYPRALPLRPVWTGLAINSVAFGALWLTVLFVWPRIRARVGRKPGRCGRCGYERSGLPDGSACPECGSVTTTAAPGVD